jgi:hypothetical protein
VASAGERSRLHEARPGTAPEIVAGWATASTGVRFATGRRGVMGTVASAAVGLSAIVAAVVFTASMDELVSRPELAGFNWDLLGRDSSASIDNAAIADRLGHHPAVERITGLSFVDLDIGGVAVPGSAWAAIRGAPWPPVSSGRAPHAPNEVLFSPATLADVGHEIGDVVTIGFVSAGDGGRRVELDVTIVGTAVSPSIALAGSETPRLDTGVLLRQEDVAGRSFEHGSAVLFDLVDGADPELIKAQFPGGLHDDVGAATEWFASAEPVEVRQADESMRFLVFGIGALLVALMVAVANSLLALVRERGRSFAVLKAIGFTPRQIARTVLWQSGIVIGAALIIAVPVGLIGGRWLYGGFADGIGVIVRPVAPLAALTLAVLGTVVLLHTVALVPAHYAARTHPARELRSE